MKGSACATAIRGGGEVFVTGLLAASGDGDGGEGFGAWFVELESGRWRRVQTTVGFSGFAFSAGLARIPDDEFWVLKKTDVHETGEAPNIIVS
ncbi:hypothetical protein HPP92_026190 [Vanilla planifolia]|uniref:Uncharacterized protein n=1 Tax=Vanilla planifolia TaxID=51239 RepID=A0A835PJQ8_VANPL|nr:hypothetical protein HPP92_026190 [Vanilla planifolia]